MLMDNISLGAHKISEPIFMSTYLMQAAGTICGCVIKLISYAGS